LATALVHTDDGPEVAECVCAAVVSDDTEGFRLLGIAADDDAATNSPQAQAEAGRRG
jgi:hypothetical protein